MSDIVTVLNAIATAWQDEQAEIHGITTTILKEISAMEIVRPGEPNIKYLDDTYKGLRKTFEEKFGGFEKSPKFPIPHKLIFLLRFWHDTGNADALNMADWTLVNMMLGGSMIMSGEDSTAIPPTNSGYCPISRRCSTTRL